MTQPNDRPPTPYSLDALVAALAALDQANAAAQAALEDLGLPGPSRKGLTYAFGALTLADEYADYLQRRSGGST